MTPRIVLPAVAVAALVAGCTAPYTTPVISDLDDNDLKVQVKSNEKNVTIEDMVEVAKPEAMRGCERFDKVPEYISHVVIQERATFGDALAEGLTRPAWAQRRLPEEDIIEVLFACVQPKP